MMSEEYTLKFGVHKGKSLQEISKEFPSYILWIAGVTTKYSLTKRAQDMYTVICKENPECVQLAKDFLHDKCYQCWGQVTSGQRHFCLKKRDKSNYEYHPYGKRT